MNTLHLLSTLVLVIIALGIWQRRNPRRHYPLMLTAFALDIGMVLYIEITRHAVEQVVEAQMSAMLWFHILISTAVLAFYFVQFWLGWRLLRGRTNLRVNHRRVGVSFCVLRLLNYVTSFVIV